MMHGPSSRILLGYLVLAGSANAQPSASAAARFLEQASWGPTTASIAEVQKLGFSPWIDSQFAAPLSPIPDVPPNTTGFHPLRPMQSQFFYNANTQPDQLRQRVAFALGQIWVVSGVKLNDAMEMTPYLRLLQKDAFTNYRQIMYDVTLSPSMGHYLDMVNNDKPNPAAGKGANENYAREILQLFTIGLVKLDDGGNVVKDAAGNPIDTYDQDTIEGFATAFTGWTYPPAPNAVSRVHNPPYWEGAMVGWDSNHDKTPKKLLNGVVLPAGQTIDKDLNGALDNIFAHTNVAPFVCRQLIQHLVTSSPSSAYVSDVVKVFRKSKGDMKMVVKAILLHKEARAGDDGPAPAAGEGHLREPVLFINGLLRSIGATVAVTNNLIDQGNNMGQNVYLPPTVFNYFAPGYQIGTTGINAPEFQILSTSTAMTRADFLNTLVYGGIAGVTYDLTPYANLAGNPGAMLDAYNTALLHGRMSTQMRTSILTAVNAQTTALAKAQAALYLIGSSWQYQVER